MLEQLAKRDKDWRRMALQICGDKMTADDLVQDMYLKFANYDKELNDYYIFFAIRSIYINNLKKRKIETVSFPNDLIINNYEFQVGLSGKIQRKLGDLNNEEYCLEKDRFETEIIKQIEALPYFERETALVTQIISQRELARQSEIPFVTINQTIKKTKENLKLWADQRNFED